jgi:hypothetical protein
VRGAQRLVPIQVGPAAGQFPQRPVTIADKGQPRQAELAERRFTAERRVRQWAGVAVSRPMLVTGSVWPAGTTAKYSVVKHEGRTRS